MLILACLSVCKLILACNGVSALEPIICGNGTFYSRDYEMCVPCSACDVYSTVSSACTTTSDTVCIKCTDESQPDLANHTACRQCPHCKAGEYMETMCNHNTSTVCRKCPEGSFSKLASYKTHCVPCTACENRLMVTDCTAALDTVCGPCKKGYFKDTNRNQCYRCVSCAPGQLHIEECKNGLPGKLCSEYFFRTQYVEVISRKENNTSETPLIPSTTIVFSSSESSQLTLIQADISDSRSSTVIFIVVVTVVLGLTLILIVLIHLLGKRLWKFHTFNSDDSTILYVKDAYDDVNEARDNQSMIDIRYQI